MKGEHKGYKTAKILIEGGQIKEFHEIFEYVPKTAVKRDLGINYTRFQKLLKRVQGFKLEELFMLSRLIGVDEITMIQLTCNEYLTTKGKAPTWAKLNTTLQDQPRSKGNRE